MVLLKLCYAINTDRGGAMRQWGRGRVTERARVWAIVSRCASILAAVLRGSPGRPMRISFEISVSVSTLL